MSKLSKKTYDVAQEIIHFGEYIGDARRLKKRIAPGRKEFDRFRTMPLPLPDVIEIAAESKQEDGRTAYPHQQKLFLHRWPSVTDAIPKGTKILVAAHEQFHSCSTFEGVHDRVQFLVAGVKGLDVMYWYDVAFRIGAFHGYLPTGVCLHLGTLQGAKRLGLPTKQGFLEMWELPQELQIWEPWEVEDILCDFNKYRRRQDRNG